jgi:hypothetical protein
MSLSLECGETLSSILFEYYMQLFLLVVLLLNLILGMIFSVFFFFFVTCIDAVSGDFTKFPHLV